MDDRATACITAFGVLEMIIETPQHTSDLWTFKETDLWNANDDLSAMIAFVRLSRVNWLDLRKPRAMTQWALRFIAAQQPSQKHLIPFLMSFKPNDTSLQDASFLTDFLFCLNSFFSPTMPRDRSMLDKR
jgi:hypothetical protein